MFRSIEKSITSPCWRRSSGTSPIPAAIAAVGDPGGSGLPSISTDAGVPAVDPEDRARDLRPPGADEPGERDDLAAPHVERDVGEDALARQPVDLQHDRPRLGRRPSGTARPCRGRPSRGSPTASSAPRPACVRTWRPSRITVTRWQIAKISSSRCETNSTALPCARSVSTMPNSRSTSVRGQRSGRLVHHDHARVRRQRLRDLDELLVGDREPAREPVGVEPDAELLEHRGASRRIRLPSMRRNRLSGCMPTKMFSATRQVGEERRLLEDDRDPGRLRLLGVVEDRLLAVEHAAGRRRAGGRRRGS